MSAIVIIGAGLAGASTAWHLGRLRPDVADRVTILDMLDRLRLGHGAQWDVGVQPVAQPPIIKLRKQRVR